MCYLTHKYHGGGRTPPHPKILAPMAPMNMKLYMHVVLIWPIFSEYNIKVRFYCLQLTELNGLKSV